MEAMKAGMSAFEKALEHVLEAEGGYVNHKNDRGGATNFGITLATLASWRKKEVTAADVKAMTRDEAAAIYKAHYWDACGLDQITSPQVATCIFDQAVNRGVKSAVKQAQRIAEDMIEKVLLIDGILGPKSAAAINACEPADFCALYIESSRNFYRGLVTQRPSQQVFLRGWMNRMDKLEKAIA